MVYMKKTILGHLRHTNTSMLFWIEWRLSWRTRRVNRMPRFSDSISTAG